MAKISAQAVKSRKDTEDFFRTVGMGVDNKAKTAGAAPTMGTIGQYDAGNVGKDISFDRNEDETASKLGGILVGVNQPKPKKEDDPDLGKKEDEDEDEEDLKPSATDVQGSDLPKTMTIPLGTTSFTLPNIGTVSKILMAQFNKSKKDKEADDLMKKLYPNMGQPDRFNNL